MKKIIKILIALFVLTFPYTVNAGNTAQITMTLVNNASADIDISPGIWQPTAGLGSNENTGESGYFTIYNNGTLMVDIYINGENSSDWTLSSFSGHDTFSLKYNLTDAGSWTSVTLSPSLFINNFSHNSFKTFDLWLYMPSSTSTERPQATNVTITIQPT